MDLSFRRKFKLVICRSVLAWTYAADDPLFPSSLLRNLCLIASTSSASMYTNKFCHIGW